MDLTTARSIPPHTCTTKSPDSDTDTETPQLQTHLSKALSLSNPHKPQPNLICSYKECLKNHAASLGGLALDGCGEFMPISNATSHDPASLKCAACGCHRNFHRRETTTTDNTNFLLTWNSTPSPNPSSPASPTPQQSVFPSAPHMLLALSNPSTVMNPHGKKRARTKFSEEQKEKMYAFAEKLGWKMVRAGDDRVVEDFCNEIGVKRKVFKVWMHNNKSRREKGSSGNDDANGGGMTAYNFNNVNSTTDFDRFRLESKVSVHAFTDDGSSSSPSS